MYIRYTNHALERMLEREISEELVEKTMRDPDIMEFSQRDASRFIAIKRHSFPHMKPHVLIVIYEVQNDNLLVITLIDTSKVNQYT